MTTPIHWTTTEDDLLKTLCLSGRHSFQDMLPLFPQRTKGSLIGAARRLGIVNPRRNQPKYTYNTAYFDEITLETCYWGAMLQTDGCLSKRGDYVTIIWGCAERDKPLMELFRQHIDSTHPIHTSNKRCQISTKDATKGHPNCRITFEGASQWAAALKRHFGFDHNKTLRTSPANLPTLKHKLAYLRGYIDGDGCITHSGTPGGIHMSVCGVNREMIQWFKDVVDSLGLPSLSNRSNNVCQQEGENCHYWRLNGLSAAVLHQLLIRVPTPYLARKWESPKVLATIEYWRSRADVWPPESFFTNILNDS